MARKRRPHVATPDEVTIHRDGDFAIIAYIDPNIETTQYRVGEERLGRMSDEDILALWNAGLATTSDDVMSRRDMTPLMDGDSILCTVVVDPRTPDQPFLGAGGRTYTAMELARLLGSRVGWTAKIELQPPSKPETHDSAEYWKGRWSMGQIGFHEGAPNRLLVRFADRLGAPGRVLVPLCGKAVDLSFLADLGHRVVGCELAEKAVEDFFRERNEVPSREAHRTWEAYVKGSIRINRTDLFDESLPLEDFDAVYDRAALVALDSDARARYAKRIIGAVTPVARMLLVTLEHDAPSGPPHSVTASEVSRLYSEAFSIEELARDDVSAESQHILAKGATFVRECAYLLTRK